MRRMFPLPAFALLALLLVAFARPVLAVEVERVTSPGGIEAWLVRDTKNPVLTMRFAFRGGAALDPEGKAGLANMVSSTIDEGAGELTSQEFQGRLQNLAITLRFDAGQDTFSGRLKTVTENRDEAIRLLNLALTKPRFDTEPVERIRAQILSGLRQAKEDPNEAASKALMQRMFQDHPYARQPEGRIETVESITVDDMRGFMARRIARDNLVIGAVGDVTKEEFGELLDRAFGDLAKTAEPWQVGEAQTFAGGDVEVVERDVPQSAVSFAQPGIKRGDDDFYAAYVVNHILGGGSFTSRLYQEIRERRGLAYSVYSYLWPLDRGALIVGGAGTANARVKETLQVLRAEWRRLAENGVSQDELDDAKTYLTGSFALRFTDSDSIAGMLLGMQLDELGIDYMNRRNALIEAVDLNAANSVAKRLWKPEALSVVVVGQPEGLPAMQ